MCDVSEEHVDLGLGVAVGARNSPPRFAETTAMPSRRKDLFQRRKPILMKGPARRTSAKNDEDDAEAHKYFYFHQTRGGGGHHHTRQV